MSEKNSFSSIERHLIVLGSLNAIPLKETADLLEVDVERINGVSSNGWHEKISASYDGRTDLLEVFGQLSTRYKLGERTLAPSGAYLPPQEETAQALPEVPRFYVCGIQRMFGTLEIRELSAMYNDFNSWPYDVKRTDLNPLAFNGFTDNNEECEVVRGIIDRIDKSHFGVAFLVNPMTTDSLLFESTLVLGQGKPLVCVLSSKSYTENRLPQYYKNDQKSDSYPVVEKFWPVIAHPNACLVRESDLEEDRIQHRAKLRSICWDTIEQHYNALTED